MTQDEVMYKLFMFYKKILEDPKTIHLCPFFGMYHLLGRYCSKTCNVLFPKTRHSNRCPCFTYKNPFEKLRNVLIGYYGLDFVKQIDYPNY
jgi:hypothetical protein